MAKQQSSRTLSPKGTDLSWFEKLSGPKQELVCVLFLYLLMLVLFRQIVFNNMMFADSGDTAAHEAVAQGIDHLKSNEGDNPLWIPFIFSGMPVFGFFMLPHRVGYLKTVLELAGKPLFLFADWGWMVFYMFLAGTLMFLLIRRMGLSHLSAIVGALVFMLNPYLVGLAEVGHGSKLATLSYIPLLFLSTYMVLEKKNLLWMGVLAASVGTVLLSQHPQIAFYGFLISGSFFLVHVIREVRAGAIGVVRKLALFGIPLLIGFAIAAYEYLPVQEYSHYSIRGGGEAGGTSGLDYDYATNWSFHPYETINYVFPAFFGAGKYTMDVQGQQFPLYWGWMPFTDSTVYVGLLPILFGVLALVYRRNYVTIFLAVCSVFMLFLSFGKHFPLLYDLFFQYFPYFNRFRVPVMVLHLMPFIVGLLSAYGIGYVIDGGGEVKNPAFRTLRKRLIVVAAIVGGVFLVGMVAKTAVRGWMTESWFFKADELQRYGAQGVAVLKENRFELFWGDFIRTSIFMLILLGAIILFLDARIKRSLFTGVLIVFTIVDLSIHSTKYINPRPADAIQQEMAPDATIRFLQADTSLYRIFPVGQALFQNNTFMYHAISSIGGYSPAKLKIYQEMIDSSLYRWPDPSMPLNMNVINMLGGKYLIANGRLPEDRFKLVNVDQEKSILTYENPAHFPRAWFVDEARVTTSKADLFGALNSPDFNPRSTALLEKAPANVPSKPASASVRVVEYRSGRIVLSAVTDARALLVLAEPYYPAGWTASVDGETTEIYKTNFVLRSIMVPSGEHRVVFEFRPSAYDLGYLLSHIGWGMTLVLIGIGLYREPGLRNFMRRNRE